MYENVLNGIVSMRAQTSTIAPMPESGSSITWNPPKKKVRTLGRDINLRIHHRDFGDKRLYKQSSIILLKDPKSWPLNLRPFSISFLVLCPWRSSVMLFFVRSFRLSQSVESNPDGRILWSLSTIALWILMLSFDKMLAQTCSGRSISDFWIFFLSILCALS